MVDLPNPPKYGHQTFLALFGSRWAELDPVTQTLDKKSLILDIAQFSVLGVGSVLLKTYGATLVSTAGRGTLSADVFKSTVEQIATRHDGVMVSLNGLASLQPDSPGQSPNFSAGLEAFASTGTGMAAALAVVALGGLSTSAVLFPGALAIAAGYTASKLVQAGFDFALETTEGRAILEAYGNKIGKLEYTFAQQTKQIGREIQNDVNIAISVVQTGVESFATIQKILEDIKSIGQFQAGLQNSFLTSVLNIDQDTANSLTKDAQLQGTLFNFSGSVALAKVAASIPTNLNTIVNDYLPAQAAEHAINQSLSTAIASAEQLGTIRGSASADKIANLIPTLAQSIQPQLATIGLAISKLGDAGSGRASASLAIGNTATLTGTAAAETLVGTPADETFDGGAGGDKIIGGGGNDVFIYKHGYGLLEIDEANGAAAAASLKLDIASAAQLTGHADLQGNLILTDGTAGDVITIDHEFLGGSGVQSISFANGASLTQVQLLAFGQTATSGADLLYGTVGPDVLDGLGGADYVNGLGGGGVFVFKSGYGALEIDETDSGAVPNTLSFGPGITPSMIVGANDASGNLLLKVGTGSDTVRLDGEMLDATRGVQAVTFANGTTWNRAALLSHASVATSGPDALYGTPGGGTIDELGGGDVVHGVGGADTIAFKAGYGTLEIDEDTGSATASAATLQIGPGILASQMTVSSDGFNALVLKFSGASDVVTIDSELSDPHFGVGSITFADGTRLTQAQLVAAAVAALPVGAGDPLFDATYYLAQNPDVAAAKLDPYQHYMTQGWKEGRNPSALFDTRYYLGSNPDVKAAGLNPLTHFETYGWKEGRQPSLAFSTSAYLAAYPDVAAAGVDPLLHFVQFGSTAGRQASVNGPVVSATTVPDPLVDASFAINQVATIVPNTLDVSAYYHQTGWKLGINPDALFDASYYLAQNPDVKAAGLDPLMHFENQGRQEGREPSLLFSDAKYLTANPDVAASGINPLLHYVAYGKAEGRTAFLAGGTAAADPLVVAAYYDKQLGATLIPAGVAGQQQAAAGYDATGWQKGLNPDAFFNTSYYLAHNPDVAAAHVDPLTQYETTGWTQGRDPSAQFSTNKYLAAYSDVKAAGMDPLLHYVMYGQAEGRTAFAA